ncbi:NHL repeat-containing protein [Magnetovibrio sp.]|uniref:NHL repeat-containing protein n=1 Tax=Magnetovibrio sp. TaxID=2024836 RepID=UPI002F95F308
MIRLVIFTLSMLCAALPARTETMWANLERVSEPLLAAPHDLTLSPDGRFLVVADMGNDRVVLLDPDLLTLEGIIGAQTLSFPHDVVFDAKGRLLVADSGNDRIVIYEFHDTAAQIVGIIENLGGPEGLAVGPHGSIYASSTMEDRVVRIHDGAIETVADSALGMALSRPHDIEIRQDATGLSIIATDPGNHRLVVFDRDLRPKFEISTWDPPFSEPKYISHDEQGRLYVADAFNNQIRVFSPDAAPLGTFAETHVKLPEGILVVKDRAWVSDTENGRVLLYRLGERR